MTTIPTCSDCRYAHELLADMLVNGICPACVERRDYETKLAALTDKRGAYVVALASCGNVDFGQHPDRSLPGVPAKRVRVATLRAASEVCRLYIEHHELGGGNWIGGDVLDAKTQAAVAKISYNGQAWKPGTYPQPEIALEAAS
jgi:hypothetical protein